jgi:hypothetical protein
MRTRDLKSLVSVGRVAIITRGSRANLVGPLARRWNVGSNEWIEVKLNERREKDGKQEGEEGVA